MFTLKQASHSVHIRAYTVLKCAHSVPMAIFRPKPPTHPDCTSIVCFSLPHPTYLCFAICPTLWCGVEELYSRTEAFPLHGFLLIIFIKYNLYKKMTVKILRLRLAIPISTAVLSLLVYLSSTQTRAESSSDS